MNRGRGDRGGHNMVMMYGMPPDRDSERFEPSLNPDPPHKDEPADHVVPLVAMPPITHNPFTGEPINVLEMLARVEGLKTQIAELTKLHASRMTELEAVCASRLAEIKQLMQQAIVDRGTIHTLETKCKGYEFQDEQRKKKGKK